MPEKLIEERFDALAGDVRAATAGLEADREERERARVAEERRTAWWRRLTVAAAVGSVLSIVACWFVYDLFRQFQDDRAAARMTTCTQQVDRDLSFNLTLLNAAGFNPDGTPGTFLTLDPDRQARTRLFLVPPEREGGGPRGGLVALRICTSEAISDFYSSGGTEGVVPIDGTDDDYSEAVTTP